MQPILRELKLAQQVDDMSTLQEKLQAFAQGVEANLVNIQQEVSRTRGEVSRTQAGIQGLIETARIEGGSVLPPSQERDRQMLRRWPRGFRCTTTQPPIRT